MGTAITLLWIAIAITIAYSIWFIWDFNVTSKKVIKDVEKWENQENQHKERMLKALEEIARKK